MPILCWAVFLIFLSNNAFAQTATRTFNTPGAGTFTVPDKITSVNVSVWGAGGGGGFTGNNRGARGGGGGAFLFANGLLVTAGNDINFIIGSGGLGQSNINPVIGNGAATSFGPLTANGGGGGNGRNGGGIGGVAGTGPYIYYSGGNSDSPPDSGNTAGAGGGAAGSPDGNGAVGTYVVTIGGLGGVGVSGAGSGGNGGASSGQNGFNGTQPGGGGGGEGGNGTSGGRGGDGRIIVSWSCPAPVLTSPLNSDNQTVCIETPINNITYELVGAYGAQISGLPDGVTMQYNGGDITISGTPTEAGTFNYEILPQGACENSIITGTISVTPNNTAGTITTNTFCEGTPLPLDIFQPTTGATGLGAPTGLPAGVSVELINNNIVFTGTPTVPGSFNYSIPLTGGCGNINATGSLIINAVAAINNPVLGAQTQCIGTPFSPMSISPRFGLTYQWFVNTIASNSGGTAIGGATTNQYTPSSATVGTSYYYVEVTSVCGSPLTVASNVSGPIVVNPGNTVSPASNSPVVCINDAIPSITHTTTNATGIGSALDLPLGVTASWAGNTITIAGTPTQSGVFNYSIPLTGGCGTAAATGTITVNAAPVINSSNTAAQEACLNSPFSPISVAAETGLSYQWYSNTNELNTGGTLIPGAISASYTPPSSAVGTMYYYVEVTSSLCGGPSVVSAVSGAQNVRALPAVFFETEPLPLGGTFCVDEDLTYFAQTGQSNYLWTLPGVAGTDYSIVSGGTVSDNSITVRWLTPGSKSLNVNYTDANGCTAASPTASSPITVQKNTFSPSIPLTPRVCIGDLLDGVTINTTLATGIGIPTGFPPGVSPTFSGNTISISGTPTASGTFNYSIPLTGGCGTVNATGTIIVTPRYELRATTSVSPSSSGGSATVTIRGDIASLPNGTYTVSYDLGLANTGTFTRTVNVVNGRGSFTTGPITDEDLTSLTINSLQRSGDTCVVPILENNITFFGVCAAVYEEDGLFYVPAGIFDISIKVWGGGGKGGNSNSSTSGGGGGGGGYSTVTVPVLPGQIIRVVVGDGGIPSTPNGGISLVTRNASDDPNFALVFANGGTTGLIGGFGAGGSGNAQNGQAGDPNIGSTSGGKGGNGGGNGGIGGVGASGPGNINGNAGSRPGGGGGGAKGNDRIGGNGGDGLVIISYSCPPIAADGCFVVVDDGARTGNTIIKFTCATSEWFAPSGLLDFSVVTVGAGGGGGMGNTGGGGGAGGLVEDIVSSTNPNGIQDGTIFNITVGDGGAGATTSDQRGGIGGTSSVTGTLDGNTIDLSAPGGGGGGSFNATTGINNGISGASGGGGAYFKGDPDYQGSGGGGMLGVGFAGGVGNIGQGQGINPAAAGGGGGGAGGAGQNGNPAGSGLARAGNGGAGLTYNNTTFGLSFLYGGGGGGVGYDGASGNIVAGTGGSGIGGNGNGDPDFEEGVGFTGAAGTGSGGGAGRLGGGAGGKGAVYIVYENFRILPVEYIFFEAQYLSEDRKAELTWATSKEWENSHFEVHRSFQNLNTWTVVGEVKGMGFSDEPVYYKFEDKLIPLTGGNVYYRLRQVDFSGISNFTKVLSVRIPSLQVTQGVWRAYPNPTSSQMRVSLLDRSGYNDEALTFRLIQANSVSESMTVSTEEEMNEILAGWVPSMSRGLFVVEIRWGQKVEHIKVLRK